MNKRLKLLLFILVCILPMPAAAQGWAALEIDGKPMQFVATATDASDGELVFGQTGLYRRLPGQDWTRVGDTPPSSPVVFGGDTLLAGIAPPCLQDGDRLEMQRSLDGGKTWNAIPGTEGYQPIAITSDPDLAFAFSCQGVYSSTDQGETWQPIPDIDISGYEVTSTAIVRDETTKSITLLLGMTSEGGTSHLVSVEIDGSTATVSEPLHEYWGRASLAGNGDTFLIGAANGVFFSTDRGKTWEQIRTGLEAVTVDFDPLVEFPTNVEPGSFGLNSAVFTSGSIVLGTVQGVYVTSEPRDGWRRLDGIDGNVEAVVLESNGETVIAQTEEGLFELPIDIGFG